MGYIEEARHRAKRRKSPWNLILIPAFLISFIPGWIILAKAYGNLHHYLYPSHNMLKCRDTVGGIIYTLIPFFVMIGPSMILANFILYNIPPARRALDMEASGIPGTSYTESNRALRKFSKLISTIALLIGLGATLLPM